MQKLKDYSTEKEIQMYFINSPLGEENDRYEYQDGAVLLVPGHKICFIDFNDNIDEGFSDFVEDFIDDIGFLSDKYDYMSELGRPRRWKETLTKKTKQSSINDIESLISSLELESKSDQRKVDFLISLLIGSINDIKRIGIDTPENLLEQVKHKIVLFDGDQSRFIYSDANTFEKKRIVIQGLAGTGKTELLLHKLKDLYTREKDSKIVFTCYNNILAKSMRKRVPEFFNFMRVNEQIEWNERLWVMRSWGSGRNPHEGLYSLICSKYGIPFRPYIFGISFDDVCTEALERLNDNEDFEPFFDYILIDESQDFPESFFALCEKVTKNKVFVAGDIFQDIYDMSLDKKIENDYLLNKCYRTDPKTLMLAHAIGMGLYETPVLRWLRDSEWSLCGYNYLREGNKCILSRIPVRRFEDLNTADIPSIKIIEAKNSIVKHICNTISEIREKFDTVEPNDIAIIILEEGKSDYQLADLAAHAINAEYGWKTVKGYEYKDMKDDAVFISNKNNIKGLEFPFIICVANEVITNDIILRNTIYMILTRSFITSYFLVNNNLLVNNTAFIETYSQACNYIQENNHMKLRIPEKEEVEQQNKKISIVAANQKKSIKEIANEIMNMYPQLNSALRKMVMISIMEWVNQNNGNFEEEEIAERIHNLCRSLIPEQ